MRNLEPALYTDPAVFARECAAIFRSSWQLIGPASRLSEPGDYVATEIAGAKIVAVRGKDGVLRAFRNVCRHRGARLFEEGEARCNVIRCQYHNWVYDLDGSLRQAPWFGEDADFNMGEWPLEPISIEPWRGLAFVAIDPSVTLEKQLGATAPELADEPIEEFRAVA